MKMPMSLSITRLQSMMEKPRVYDFLTKHPAKGYTILGLVTCLYGYKPEELYNKHFKSFPKGAGAKYADVCTQMKKLLADKKVECFVHGRTKYYALNKSLRTYHKYK